METVYLDQAATSFPKALGLGQCMQHYFDTMSVNINRSTYNCCTQVSTTVLETRELLCELFHFDLPSHVIFTPGITHSLNYIIKGYLKAGDHCIISPFEHNASVRALCQLEEIGVSYNSIPCDSDGRLKIELLPTLIKPNTKLVVLTHASNVFGQLLPIEEIGTLLEDYNIPLVLDTAQTAGHLPIDFYKLKLSALCFTGHKGLQGPSGIGGMLLTKSFAKRITPLIAGGTGSASHLLTLPSYMPDRFESGTLNLAGIWGLHHALTRLKASSIQQIQAYEQSLVSYFLDALSTIPHIKVLQPYACDGVVGTVSLQFSNLDQAEAAYRLEQDYGILIRCGLHCSPLAHQALGTYPEGTIRFSFNHTNTRAHLDHAIHALRQLVS